MKKVTSYLLLSTLVCQSLSTGVLVYAEEEQKDKVDTEVIDPFALEEDDTTENEIIENVPNEDSNTIIEELPSDNETTPEQKPEETPEQKPEETPEQKPEEKPEQKPEEKPEQKPEQKPNQSDSNNSYVINYQGASVNSLDKTPIQFKVTKTTQEFINEIGEQARKIGQENDLYASVMIAQAILESGSGQSSLSTYPNYNLFGIKGDYKGQSATFYTLEDTGSGSLYGINASFRKYPSVKESLEDYATLMKEGLPSNQDFYKGVTKKEAATYKEATAYLTGRYATDTRYDEKLNALIETYDLTYFDQAVKKGTRVTNENRKIDTYEVMNPENKKTSVFSLPLDQAYTVTSPFGQRGNEHHDGIDLAIAANTPVYAASDGVVVGTGFDSSAGNYVIIRHANELYTNYFHLNAISVSLNDKVTSGNMIGLVGSTGNSTGSHLHFGISTAMWKNYLDPTAYFEF